MAKIACGGNHTVLLLDNGTAYACGDTSCGQLGRGERWEGWRDLLEGVRDVACGWEFTVAINGQNEVVSCGSGPKGELGLGAVKKTNHFQKVMDVSEDSRLFASLQNCTVVVPTGTSGSKVYGWGSNTKCQLHKPKSRVVDRPVVIYESASVRVKYAALGRDFILLIDAEGRIVHTSGAIPVEFNLEMWATCAGLDVLCMWTSMHIWAPGKGLYSYGNGNHGQLFKRDEWCPSADIKSVAVGSEHGVLLTKPGTVACWGWGEHGNCGRLRRDSGSIINDRSNVISPLCEVFEAPAQCLLFAGCATTWIVSEC